MPDTKTITPLELLGETKGLPYFSEEQIDRACEGYWWARLKAAIGIDGWHYHKPTGAVIQTSEGCTDDIDAEQLLKDINMLSRQKRPQ